MNYLLQIGKLRICQSRCTAIKRSVSFTDVLLTRPKHSFEGEMGNFTESRFDVEVDLKPSKKSQYRITTPLIDAKERPAKSSKTHQGASHVKRDDRISSAISNKRKSKFGIKGRDNFVVDHKLSGLGTYERKRLLGKTRKSTKEYLFGIFPVLLALECKSRTFHKLYVRNTKYSEHIGTNNTERTEDSLSAQANNKQLISKIIALAESENIEIVECDGKRLTELSGDRPHQGVCLCVSSKHYVELQLENLFKDEEMTLTSSSPCASVWLYLEAVRDPMNFGAILRSAYYFGINKIICSSMDSCSLSPVVSKVSAGVLELLPVYNVHSHQLLAQKLKEDDWTVVGTVGQDYSGDQYTAKTTPLHRFSTQRNVLLILGNEGTGLSAESLALCDELVTVPSQYKLHECVDSLNVSVATGIVLHHMSALHKGTIT